jgi:hypothetical protein
MDICPNSLIKTTVEERSISQLKIFCSRVVFPDPRNPPIRFKLTGDIAIPHLQKHKAKFGLPILQASHKETAPIITIITI